MTEPERKLLMMLIHGSIAASMRIEPDPNAQYIGDLLAAAEEAGISIDDLYADTRLRMAVQVNDPH